MESDLLEDSARSVLLASSIEVREKPPSDRNFVTSLLIPALFIFVIVILFPIIVGIFITFRESTGITGYFGRPWTFTGRSPFTNYYWILLDGGVKTRDFWQYTYQTLFFAIVSLIIEFGLGIWFAKLLNKKFKGRGLARATILIPWAFPTIASATIFRYEIFAPADQYGLVNNLLQLLSLQPVAFFGPDAAVLFKLPALVPYNTGAGGFFPYITEFNITTTMFVAIGIDVWKTTPFLTLLILAVLQIVPEDLNKAADIAGATGWQKFRYITWPLIKQGVGVALVFRMMDALRVYDAIVVFRDKEVKSMTWYAANLWLSNQEYGLAATVAIILFIFIIAFYFIISRFTRGEREQTPKRKAKRKKDREPAEIPLEILNNNVEMESDFDLSLFESETRIEEFSESKVTWIRIKLLLNQGAFAFSVFFMCLFCAIPFLWVIIRSFRDPYIPQSSFETFNLTVAITLILFIISVFFIISAIRWQRSRKVIFIISVILFFGFLASPFIWIIIRANQVPLTSTSVFVYSYFMIFIMVGLLILSVYFIITKYTKREIKTPIGQKSKELPNGGIPKTESSLVSPKQSGLKSRIISTFEQNKKKPLFWIKLIILIASIFFIFLFGTNFSAWLRNKKLASIKAFQVVFATSEFTGVSFSQALINSFTLSGLTVVVVLIVASLIAYGLAKFDFSGKWVLNAFIFSMTSLPPIIIIIPFFIQTAETSAFFSSNKIFLSILVLLIGIALAILEVVLYKKLKNYKKKLFIATLSFIAIIIIGLFLYLDFSYLLILNKQFSLTIIIILGIILLVIDTVVYVLFKFLDRNYSGKLFIVSLVIIIIAFYCLYDFVNTLSDPFDLRDNKYGLVLPYSALNLPLAVFVLQAFFREIPEDLWKAAKVDGASNFQIFRKIILPLTIPGIFTCAILVFIASWNELLFAQIWLPSDINHTVPRAILRFVQSPLSLTADWDTNIALMAATTIATVPLVILVLIFQRKIISGLTRGAVKG
ncbi:MAG: ABC transporter permease subunit [Candidatus Thorarchaeota archaeon]